MRSIKINKKNFNIDDDMVKHIAYLVRVNLSDNEARAFSKQFTTIIEYFHLLNEVDTRAIQPANQITKERGVMREDRVTSSMEREKFLENAPKHEGGFIKVPLILGEE